MDELDPNEVTRGITCAPDEPGAVYWHAALTGSAVLALESGAHLPFTAERVGLITENTSYRLYSESDNDACVVRGTLRLASPGNLLLSMLPASMLLNLGTDAIQRDWFDAALKLQVTESRDHRPGGPLMGVCMSVTLLVMAIRQWQQKRRLNNAFFSLLFYPELLSVVEAMLMNPDHSWTVEMMAKKAHMSRARFAALFRQAANSTPMAMLTTIRMELAARQLVHGAEKRRVLRIKWVMPANRHFTGHLCSISAWRLGNIASAAALNYR